MYIYVYTSSLNIFPTFLQHNRPPKHSHIIAGKLWAEAIWMEGPHGRRAKSIDALKKCEHNPHVLIAAARLFWSERKIKKARDWFQKAVNLDTDNGDGFANFLAFEQIHGKEVSFTQNGSELALNS